VAFEQNISALALLAGVDHVTMQTTKEHPFSVLLEVQESTEESILIFLKGLDELSLDFPCVEKLEIFRSAKEGLLHMRLYLVRIEQAFPLAANLPYDLPESLEVPNFRLFSRASSQIKKQKRHVEGYLRGPCGQRISIAGKWLCIGSPILSYRVKDIDPRGVFLQEENGAVFYLKIGEALP
jgi:hypothetical protein